MSLLSPQLSVSVLVEILNVSEVVAHLIEDTFIRGVQGEGSLCFYGNIINVRNVAGTMACVIGLLCEEGLDPVIGNWHLVLLNRGLELECCGVVQSSHVVLLRVICCGGCRKQRQG